MDRTVRKVPNPGAVGPESVEPGVVGAETTEPGPAEKLLKYFPEAALALYITLDPMWREVTSGLALRFWLWGTLVLAIAFCWLYLDKFWHVNDNRQKIFSAGALVLYVAAIGGPFDTIAGYRTLYGTIAAVVATAFLIFVPSKATPSPPDP